MSTNRTLLAIAIAGWLVAATMLYQMTHRFNGAIMDELYTVEAQCGIGPSEVQP